MNQYDHKKIEKKWQKVWEKKKVYQTLEPAKARAKKMKPYYVLDMFPYPSGSGLHVGHPRGYIGSDVFARMKRMQGFNVLHPMGYDAFGLPAEQYAIENKVHPRIAVEKNIKTFRSQLDKIGFSYDWNHQVNTTDPEYYKWTQWIFLQLYNSYYDHTKKKARPISELIKKLKLEKLSEVERQKILMKYRLAYEGYSEVNWCPHMGTVLANDEVKEVDGKLVSERGDYPVEKKSMRQWFLRITDYADRLLEGLEAIDWPQNIKEIQKNWIGKSEGSEIDFKVNGTSEKITVFTTRADTLFGATYVVLAPEHELVQQLKSHIKNWGEVENYIQEIKNKSDEDRIATGKEKTGVELKGVSVINPANNEKIPVWIADYVLASYGTGAIMAVPQHDERDCEFAKKFNLPIIDRPLVSISEIIKKVNGKMVTKYKMRDAVFARQRYWGEPIPLIHNDDGTISEVPMSKLPLKLPNVKSYQPTGTGESPLAGVKEWVAKGYETNTMPGWAGSSWYFLRYMDPKNKKQFASKKNLDYWQSVDMYVGGAEHATGHLLYARFWHKFLFDLGYVKTNEPFDVLRNQGMIGGTDGRRMSKRWGNVVNPDDVIAQFGADSLRVFEMFLGPFESGLPWSTDGIVGSRRFIERVWKLQDKVIASKTTEKIIHKTIKKVTEDIINFNFNTAISSMMICVNEMEKMENISQDDFKRFLQILAPFAPHIAEELWGEKTSIHLSGWPKYNPKLVIDDTITLGIQINGKVRAEIELVKDMQEAEVRGLVMSIDEVKKWIDGKEIKKFIFIPNKIISIVVG